MHGRCALVTGAGSGNGRAIALGFARAGAMVVCADLNGPAAQSVTAAIREDGGSALGVAMDVTRAEDCRITVEAAIEHYGGIDILVNNAGVLVRGGLEAVSPHDWERAFAVNTRGPFLMTQAAVGSLKQRRGNVVMVASAAGLRGSAGHLAYASSKHALVGMTRCLALELGPLGVRVNAVCPGLVNTPMIADMIEQQTRRAAAYPLGRIGEPEDVAQAVLHLASDAASWTTGLCYAVDGGSLLATA